MDIFEKNSTPFETSIVQDPTITCVQCLFLFLFFFILFYLVLVLQKWQFWRVFGEKIVKEL